VALIELKLAGKSALVGDFSVTRALPQVQRRLVGPFCFVDHMGPHTALGTEGGGVLPHPHIGLSTVTFLFDGEILHRDSLGTEQVIRPGDVNWMTAGRGIVHSERTPQELVGKSSTMHGLQIWVGLPKADEECEPSFQHFDKEQLPFRDDGDVQLRVVLGEWDGLRSPVKVSSPLFYVVAELEAGAELKLPAQFPERAVYVVEGDIGIDGESISAHEIVILKPGETGVLCANTKSRIAIFGGEPFTEPRFMMWNFVSSRKERLEEARRDWIARKFPLVPGDEAARVPFPGEDRT
jgi:redox-sensitive bicupin YhaK (pirin superfamily)